MLTRLALTLMRSLQLLPAHLLSRLGTLMGAVLMALGAERRRVVQTNLKLCFPELSDVERANLVRAHFRAAGRAFADTAIAWWGSAERIRQLARLEGAEHLRRAAAAGPTIVFAPHFVGIEIMVTRLTLDFDGVAMYSRQKNPVFDEFLLSRRVRFRPIHMVSRPEGIKPAIRAMRKDVPLLLMADMDLGARDALFVPFFGVAAATVTALPRIAAITGAAVVPVTVTQQREGYLVRIFPPWSDYPDGDLYRDTCRMNLFIEACARETPEQYYWLHKRFKTRPEGEERFY
jgi:Kdo2-lipid IVA lauroyltransferase/acyltransferase